MLSSLLTKYYQFLEHWRQESLLSACCISLYKCEEMVPTMKELGTLGPLPPSEEGDLPLLDIGPENIDSSGVEYPLRSRRQRAEHFFRRGYRNIAMVRDGHVVADVWYVTRKTARTPQIHPHVSWFGINLGDDEVYMFDLHVETEQRGGGIATRFHRRVLEEMRDRGCQRAYGCFVTHNIPALWMHRLIGYRELPPYIVRRVFLYETARAKS